jgi:hypothetical protein
MPSERTSGGAGDPPGEQADELLTVDEAARRFNFSPQNLRRRAAKGGFPGARQVSTDGGLQWVIPAASFAALGYRSVVDARERDRRAGPAPARPGPVADDELEGDRRRLGEERAALAADREALARLAEEQEVARAEIEAERRSLEAERRQLARERAAFERRRRTLGASTAAPEPGAEPLRARLARRASADRVPAWVAPDGGACPTTHPVKAKLRSGVYRLPGASGYERARPDRCYRDEQAAVDDGLAPARR